MKTSLLLSAALLGVLTACSGGGGSSSPASSSGTGGTTGALTSTPVANSAAMASLPDLAAGQINWDQRASASTPDGFYIVARDKAYTQALGDVLLVTPSGAYAHVGTLPTPQADAASAFVPGMGLLVIGGTSDLVTASPAISLVTPTGISHLGALQVARSRPGALLLGNGKVLVAGGTQDSTAELLDPATGTSTLTGPTVSIHASAQIYAVGDGRVILVDAGSASSEIYDPTAATWSAGPRMDVPVPTGYALAKAGHYLVLAGGTLADMVTPHQGADVLDLTNMAAGWITRLWTMDTGEVQRNWAQATLRADGHLVVVGGVISSSPLTQAAHDLDFDPATGTWTSTAPRSAQAAPSVVGALPDGRIVVQGGSGHPDAVIWSH